MCSPQQNNLHDKQRSFNRLTENRVLFFATNVKRRFCHKWKRIAPQWTQNACWWRSVENTTKASAQKRTKVSAQHIKTGEHCHGKQKETEDHSCGSQHHSASVITAKFSFSKHQNIQVDRRTIIKAEFVNWEQKQTKHTLSPKLSSTDQTLPLPTPILAPRKIPRRKVPYLRRAESPSHSAARGGKLLPWAETTTAQHSVRSATSEKECNARPKIRDQTMEPTASLHNSHDPELHPPGALRSTLFFTNQRPNDFPFTWRFFSNQFSRHEAKHKARTHHFLHHHQCLSRPPDECLPSPPLTSSLAHTTPETSTAHWVWKAQLRENTDSWLRDFQQSTRPLHFVDPLYFHAPHMLHCTYLQHVEFVVLVAFEALCHCAHGPRRFAPEVQQCWLVVSQNVRKHVAPGGCQQVNLLHRVQLQLVEPGFGFLHLCLNLQEMYFSYFWQTRKVFLYSFLKSFNETFQHKMQVFKSTEFSTPTVVCELRKLISPQYLPGNLVKEPTFLNFSSCL